MNALKRSLEEALGAERVSDMPSTLEALRRDICRFELGEPRLAASPTCEKEVVDLLRLAKASRVPVVPYGKRSAYWRPLGFKEAIAMSVDGLRGLEDRGDGRTWFGAGTSVREVHETLLARGAILGCHPDAYGDTSIGAMVATGFKSGCGMGSFSLSDIIDAVRIVSSDGAVYETGQPGALEQTDVRHFFGGSGSLGVMTAIAVRPHQRTPRAQIRFSCDAQLNTLGAIIEMSQALESPGFYETFRAIRSDDGSGERGFDVDIILRAPGGLAERTERVSIFVEAMNRRFPDTQAEVVLEEADGPEKIQRWWGRAEEHWEGAGHQWYSAVDFNVEPADAFSCAPTVLRSWEDAKSAGCTSRRFGLYMAPGLVNMGLHVMYPRGGRERFEQTHPVAWDLMNALKDFPIRPYGCRGRAWPAGKGPLKTADPEIERLMKLMNPDGLLHPGAVI